MTHRTPSTGIRRGAVSRALFVLAALLLIGTAAQAQIAWNPPCTRVTVTNLSSRTFNGTINTTPAGLIPGTPIASGGSNIYPMPFGSTVDDVTTPYGNTYGFISTGLNVWTVFALTMGPPDWCVDVIADLNTCSITIVDSNGPWPCND